MTPKAKNHTAGKANRPPCPDCGSGQIISDTLRWQCKECGRKFMKKYRGREFDYSGRPPCPVCNGGRITSHGPDWICLDCGKYFRKREPRSTPDKFIPITEVKTL